MSQRIILCVLMVSTALAEGHDENRRSIVISSGGAIKFIVGLSVPVELPVSLNFVQNIQYQYMMITNATQLSYMNLLRSSTNLIISRNTAYRALAHTWNNIGINGTDCVLQIICDIGKHPLSHNGILGEIIDTVFTPHQTSETIYHEAMLTGKRGQNCRKAYSFCKRNVLDYFTKIK